MPFVNDKVFFIHIPKTGGSFVEYQLNITEHPTHKQPNSVNPVKKFLKKKNNEAARLRGFGAITGRYVLQHTTLQELLDFNFVCQDNFDKLTFFAVFRDPLERIHSAYKYWSDTKTKSFNDFVEEFRCSNGIAFGFDLLQHLKPQCSFVNLRTGKARIEWLQFDNLTSELDRFCTKHQIKASNKSTAKINATKEIKIELSNNNTDFLKEFYKEDYNLSSSIIYNYEQPN